MAALLIAQLDLADVVLLGARAGLADDLDACGDLLGYEPRVTAGDWPDLGGSDVVVLAGVGQRTGKELADRCAHAVVVVASGDQAGDVAALLEATHFPRARILGVAVGSGDGHGPLLQAAGAARLVDHVLRDRRRVVEAYVLCRTADDDPPGDEVRRAEVRVGARGAEEIL
ncbi:MAG: hypothetical protein HZB46_18450 [Solirubrobacterales bacterium]|nr:hypothetical protein [Solirubrobacterales bacterium]